MNRRSPIGLTILLLASPAFSQQPKPPAFEFVDVHASAPNAEMVGGRFRAGSRFEASGYTMVDLISRAYNLPWERIAGGPPGHWTMQGCLWRSGTSILRFKVFDTWSNQKRSAKRHSGLISSDPDSITGFPRRTPRIPLERQTWQVGS